MECKYTAMYMHKVMTICLARGCNIVLQTMDHLALKKISAFW